jgi:hypothetical protein
MATIFKVLGDVIAAIQARSTSAVTYSVTLNPNANGFYGVLRNGVQTSQFMFPGVGRGDLSGAATDANSVGLLIQLITPDGVSGKADPAVFVNSLA